MSLDPQLLQQIELLLMFDSRNPLEGLKVHHEADPGKSCTCMSWVSPR